MATKKIMGLVEQLNFKPLAETDQYGNNFRRSMKVNGEWYSFGSCKQDKWNVKQGMDFKVLGVGSEVVFPATSREYNGKTYWDAKAGSMAILEFVEASNEAPKPQAKPAAQNASSGSIGGYKKDFSGVQTGHALNAAMNLLKNKVKNDQELIDTAKAVHDVSEKIKAEYAKDNPSMSDYDVGAASGNAILNACKLAKNMDQVEEMARGLLYTVVPQILAHVKGEVSKVGVEEQEEEPELDGFEDTDLPF